MDLLNTVKSRYTTKAYDPEKKIPQEKLNKLLEILRFTPSSVNIQMKYLFLCRKQLYVMTQALWVHCKHICLLRLSRYVL